MYLVYRVYSNEERSNISERSVFYGWSTDKSIVKAFQRQRSRNKYKIYKINNDHVRELDKSNSVSLIDNNHMIDFIILQSTNGEEYHFFSTAFELCNAEKKIQRMIHDMVSFSNNNYKVESYSFDDVNLFCNLKDYYLKALLYIGFKPEDLDLLFPSADYHDDINNIQTTLDDIEDAYDSSETNIIESCHRRPAGLMNFTDVSNKIVYSLEAFVKVLKDDL